MNTLINRFSSMISIANLCAKQYTKLKTKSTLTASLLLSCFLTIPTANASLLLDVDLSIENTISISATSGSSLINASGSDIIGVYLDGFFGSNTIDTIFTSAISGDLTSANETSDLSPSLFHRAGDPGLNIFSFSNASVVSFTQGALAFVGSATWSLSESAYKHALNSAKSGNIFFPADTIDDLNNAFVIGSWAVKGIDAQIPEPTTIAIFMLGLVSAGISRIRRSKSTPIGQRY